LGALPRAYLCRFVQLHPDRAPLFRLHDQPRSGLCMIWYIITSRIRQCRLDRWGRTGWAEHAERQVSISAISVPSGGPHALGKALSRDFNGGHFHAVDR
jgi:hypothetical protein